MSAKEEKGKVTALEIAKIVVPLLSLPVGTLILALVPQVRDHIWPATPKGLLLALLVLTLSIILGLVPYALRLRRKYQSLSTSHDYWKSTAEARELAASKAQTESGSLYAQLNTDFGEATAENRNLKAQLDNLLAKDDGINLDLQQALSQLHAFNKNLPTNGDIEAKFVTEYHGIVARIERETGHNLNSFLITSSEIDHHVSHIPARRRGSFVLGEPRYTVPASTRYSEKRYCDREVFLMRLHGLIDFLASLSIKLTK